MSSSNKDLGIEFINSLNFRSNNGLCVKMLTFLASCYLNPLKLETFFPYFSSYYASLTYSVFSNLFSISAIHQKE